MAENNNERMIILIDTNRNLKLLKLFKLFQNNYEIRMKQIWAQMPVSELYLSLKSLERINKYLATNGLPKILETTLMPYQGKQLKALRKCPNYTIKIKTEYSFIEIKHTPPKNEL